MGAVVDLSCGINGSGVGSDFVDIFNLQSVRLSVYASLFIISYGVDESSAKRLKDTMPVLMRLKLLIKDPLVLNFPRHSGHGKGVIRKIVYFTTRRLIVFVYVVTSTSHCLCAFVIAMTALVTDSRVDISLTVFYSRCVWAVAMTVRVTAVTLTFLSQCFVLS